MVVGTVGISEIHIQVVQTCMRSVLTEPFKSLFAQRFEFHGVVQVPQKVALQWYPPNKCPFKVGVLFENLLRLFLMLVSEETVWVRPTVPA